MPYWAITMVIIIYIIHVNLCIHTHTHNDCFGVCTCLQIYMFCIHSKIFEVSLQSKNLHRFFHCSVRRDSQD